MHSKESDRKKIGFFDSGDSGEEREPLVNFNASHRAQLSILEEAVSGSMPAVTRRKARATAARKKGSSKIRFVKGRVKLHVAGFPGIQSLSPTHLVRHIAASKLKVAAKKVLGKVGKRKGGRNSRRKKSKKKSKKGRKAKKQR